MRADGARHRPAPCGRFFRGSSFGSSFTTKIDFGALNAGSRARQCARISSCDNEAPGGEHDEAGHLLAIDRIGQPRGGSLGDAGKLVQHGVDLERRDVDAAADDQVFVPSHDDQMPVGIEEAEVAGVMAVARQSLDRAVGIEVAERLLQAAADDDLAELAVRHRGPAVVDDPDRLIFQRRPDRSDLAPRAPVRGGVAAFAAAAALAKRDAERPLERLPGLEKERRGAAGEEFQVRQIACAHAGRRRQQHVDHRRHHEADIDVVSARATRDSGCWRICWRYRRWRRRPAALPAPCAGPTARRRSGNRRRAFPARGRDSRRSHRS